MKEEYIKERIRFYTEVLKLIVALLVTSVGGTLSMLFKRNDELAFWIAIAGIWFSFSLFFLSMFFFIKIESLLRELKNGR